MQKCDSGYILIRHVRRIPNSRSADPLDSPRPAARPAPATPLLPATFYVASYGSQNCTDSRFDS